MIHTVNGGPAPEVDIPPASATATYLGAENSVTRITQVIGSGSANRIFVPDDVEIVTPLQP